MTGRIPTQATAVGLCWARVGAEHEGWPGVQVVETVPEGGGPAQLAIVFLELMPPVAVGDRVLVNTTAVQLALGSGGYHLVVSHQRADQALRGPGHLIKLRYTPWQLKVFGPEDPDHPDHQRLIDADQLSGMPVAAAELYSQIGPLAGAFAALAPGRRLVLIMNDSAALSYAFGRLAPQLRAAGLLAGTISAGQAFGGEVEAVTVHSALLIARHLLAADAVVVSGGPGLMGSHTPFGHTGIAQGEALNAAVALQGRPLAVLRMSLADPRERHQGLSHHTRTVLERVVLASVAAAIPANCPDDLATELTRLLAGRHRLVRQTQAAPWRDILRHAGIEPRSMGRVYDQDPLYFEAAAAAGAELAQWVQEDA